MSEDNTLTIIGEDGKEVKCEVLFTYEDERTGKNFIAYTDNTLDYEGNTKVYASSFDPEGDNPVLFPIEDEDEWAIIEAILDSLTNDTE